MSCTTAFMSMRPNAPTVLPLEHLVDQRWCSTCDYVLKPPCRGPPLMASWHGGRNQRVMYTKCWRALHSRMRPLGTGSVQLSPFLGCSREKARHRTFQRQLAGVASRNRCKRHLQVTVSCSLSDDVQATAACLWALFARTCSNGLGLVRFPVLRNVLGKRVVRIGRTQKGLNTVHEPHHQEQAGHCGWIRCVPQEPVLSTSCNHEQRTTPQAAHQAVAVFRAWQSFST